MYTGSPHSATMVLSLNHVITISQHWCLRLTFIFLPSTSCRTEIGEKRLQETKQVHNEEYTLKARCWCWQPLTCYVNTSVYSALCVLFSYNLFLSSLSTLQGMEGKQVTSIGDLSCGWPIHLLPKEQKTWRGQDKKAHNWKYTKLFAQHPWSCQHKCIAFNMYSPLCACLLSARVSIPKTRGVVRSE